MVDGKLAAFVGLGDMQTVCTAGAVPGAFLPTYLRRRRLGTQVGSVLSGPRWNVHGDSTKKFRFEPGIFIKSL